MMTNVEKAADRWPPGFRLRGFPDQVFKLDVERSYQSDGKVYLIIQTEAGLDFTKATPEELRKEAFYFNGSRADHKAQALGARVEGGINWTWAFFGDRQAALDFAAWLDRNGYEHRGIRKDDHGWAIRYR